MEQRKTQFSYRRHPDQNRVGTSVAEHPVVVVGAGPIGLSLAIDLAQRGQRVVLLATRTRSVKGRARSASQNARSNTGIASA
jgi:3-(3-hydroxy-phenyl)propionate hydroxylase